MNEQLEGEIKDEDIEGILRIEKPKKDEKNRDPSS